MEHSMLAMIIDTSKIFGLEFFYPDAFWQLVIRFIYNFCWVFIPSYFLYFKNKGDKEYFFTFIVASAIVFQICMLLGTVSLRIGFALGLFAIFGILRYRTNPIPPREMTYLFLVIGMSVKNSLANENISMSELLVTDVMTVVVTYFVERYLANIKLQRKSIVYDRTDLILPEKYDDLLNDLSSRLGVKVKRADIGPIDLIRDRVVLNIYFEKVEGIKFFDTFRD